MEENLYNSAVYVNTSDFKANIQSIIHSLPDYIDCIPVLKGNAYGLGLVPLAKIAAQFPEIHTLAIAQLSEAFDVARSRADPAAACLGQYANGPH